MSTTILNEHDANQGAQSKGEFLGMTGNSGWYLLGSAGMTVMMVIVLWGVFGVSLLLCIMFGVVLCLLAGLRLGRAEFRVDRPLGGGGQLCSAK